MHVKAYPVNATVSQGHLGAPCRAIGCSHGSLTHGTLRYSTAWQPASDKPLLRLTTNHTIKQTMQAAVVCVHGLPAICSKATCSMVIRPPYTFVCMQSAKPINVYDTTFGLPCNGEALNHGVSKGKSHACASRLLKGFALDCKLKGYHDHLNGDNLVLCMGKRCIQGPTHAGAQQQI